MSRGLVPIASRITRIDLQSAADAVGCSAVFIQIRCSDLRLFLQSAVTIILVGRRIVGPSSVFDPSGVKSVYDFGVDMDRILDGIDASSIGARLRLTREVLGFTQAEFADRCDVARNTYNQYEHGKNVPQVQQAIRLCESFELTLDWIYRGEPGGLPYKLVDDLRTARVR